jgi:endoglycosylceramidase
MLSKATTVLATAAALSGTFSASAASLAPIKLKQRATGERVFVEATTGREVFFHGVNAIVKGAPYIPETEYFDIDISLSREDHEALADLGVNVYRLGSMWKGLEPTRGVYEENYLKKLEQIVTEAEEYGIYTLLDMHQDDFSEKFCGEGVPDWAAIPSPTSPSDDFPSPLHEPYTATSTIDGYPTRQDCALFNWPSYYNTQAVGSAFQNLYTNTDNLLDSWANFWITLVKRFNPISYPSILGIELINEPWAGDTVTNPKLLLPSYADQHMLQPAYDYLAQQIREISHDILIFFAAVTWDDIIPVGFTHAPGGEGEEYAGSAVFAYHYYEPPQLTEEIYFPTRIKDAQRLHVASMLTEFERSDPTNANSTDGFVETADAADKYLQSWAMW